MPIHIALLRAVNVGGTAKLPMSGLRAACEAAGLRNVETYIASGNLVFESALDAAGAEHVVAGVLRDAFGLTKNHALVRTADEVAAAMSGNPFEDAARERPNWLSLYFLSGAAHENAARIVAEYGGPERLSLAGQVSLAGHVSLAGQVLYVDFVNGAGRSKITPAFLDKTLGTPATARNWNTCGKLVAMARARGG